MKESIKDTITAFNDRLRSPFYLAFALSWIFINWEIVLAIIYPAFTLSKNETLIVYIKPRVNFYTNIVYPFFSALTIILIVQIIDFFVGVYVDFMRNHRKKKRINMMKDVPVSGEEYVELYIKTKAVNDTISDTLKSIKSKDITLANIQSKLATIENDNFVLTTEIERKDKVVKQLTDRINKLQNIHNVSDLFNGEWKIKKRLNRGYDYTVETFTVSNNKVWSNILRTQDGGFKYVETYCIDLFSYDNDSGTLEYLKYDINGDLSNWRIGVFKRTTKDKLIFEGIEKNSDKQYMEVILEKVK